MMISNTDTSAPAGPVGVILAGGLARRMGGVDKGLIDIRGKPLLAHLVARLAPQCAGLALNANGDPGRFAAFRLPVVADSVTGFAGPLAGVLAGMDYCAQAHPAVETILTVPADTPFIPHDLAARLDAARNDAGARIAVAASDGRLHHTVALWPVSLRDDLRRALTIDDERRVSGFIARYANVAVDWPVEPRDPFFNVNRPEDVEKGQGIARQG